MCRNIQVTALLGHMAVDAKYFAWIGRENSDITEEVGILINVIFVYRSDPKIFHFSKKIETYFLEDYRKLVL